MIFQRKYVGMYFMYFAANKKEMNVIGFGLLPSVFSEYINL